MIIDFKKPCSETNGKYYINLDVGKVKLAKKRKEMITIKLPQGYCEPVDPKNLLKYGKRTEAVYLYPDNPMKLVGQYYVLQKKESDEQFFKKYNIL